LLKTKEIATTKKPKIVAVNGSPNRHGGNTGQMQRMLEKTLVDEGREVKTICLAEKCIWFCAGCGFCLENVAGKCWIKDDQRSIVEDMLAADGIILASPVMGYAVKEEREIMTGDYKHWTEHNLFDGFEAYIKQNHTRFPLDREHRKAALKKVFDNHLKQYRQGKQ
jgi:hypothetical protein